MVAATVPMMTLAMPAAGQVLGADAAACTGGGGPAILVTIVGLKDRTGTLKLELYPATQDDFLKDDRDLIAQGKTFRRVSAAVPGGGNVQMCIRVPHAGRFALFATHDRDGKNKFNFFQDGAGFPSNTKLGMSRPKLQAALIDVGGGVANTVVRMQYLHGLGGFGPQKD